MAIGVTGSAAIETGWRAGPSGLAAALDLLPELLERVPGATLFNQPEWLSAATGLDGRRATTPLVGSISGRPVILLPLTWGWETVHGFAVRTLRMLGDPLADRVALPLDRSVDRVVDGFLDGLRQCERRWDVAVLSELPRDPELRASIDGWCRGSGFVAHWRWCARVPQLTFDGGAVYGKSLRTRLQRARKKMDAAGGCRVERVCPTPEDVPALLATIKAVEDASWKGDDAVGIFSTPARCRFFADVSARLAARGALEVYLLRVSDTVISYRYGFRHRDVFLDYNLAYLPEFAGLSPGRVLLDEIIRDCRSRGLAGVDASRASLKTGHLLSDWTDRYVDHDQLWLFAPTARGRIARMIALRLKPLARRALASLAPGARPDAAPRPRPEGLAHG